MSRQRGQTTLDFTVGISVFLAVIVFVFAFFPTMFAPFESDTGGDAAVADRVADRLSADALAESPADPSVLNDTCTEQFFGTDGMFPAGCRYTDDSGDLRAAVGVDDLVHLNVTVRTDSGIRTLGGTRLAAGEHPTTVDDPIVAKRVVLLSGEQNRLFVRVW
jgi:hypothetical protein